MLTRRVFLQTTAATGAATFVGGADLLAAKYDLVIRGGSSKLFAHASVVAGKLVRRVS